MPLRAQQQPPSTTDYGSNKAARFLREKRNRNQRHQQINHTSCEAGGVPKADSGESKMSKFSNYEYRTQPGFDMNTFAGANQAIPMKTLVIHCFDPRAAEIPQAVAAYLGDEVYPGENVLDKSGNRVGHTRTLFAETNAGGRAAFALESVAAMDYIFSVQNVVVVHHSFCGTTTLTPELLIEEFRDHYHADIATMFDRDSLAIMDFETSVKHDIALLRSSPAVPKHIKLYGFFYEISSGKLTEVARDIPT
jgi:carbonic anhydrase